MGGEGHPRPKQLTRNSVVRSPWPLRPRKDVRSTGWVGDWRGHPKPRLKMPRQGVTSRRARRHVVAGVGDEHLKARGLRKGPRGVRRHGGEPVDQRIESFLANVLALAGEDLDAIREGVRIALADCEEIYRAQKKTSA
jgi:hypothetical protein